MKRRHSTARGWLREWALVLWLVVCACFFAAIGEPITAVWAATSAVLAAGRVYSERSIAARDQLIEIQHRTIMKLGAAVVHRVVSEGRAIRIPTPADVEKARRN